MEKYAGKNNSYKKFKINVADEFPIATNFYIEATLSSKVIEMFTSIPSTALEYSLLEKLS